jgi:acetyl esterase/lipase
VAICPGGGFSILAWDLEGTEVARWFTDRGFVAAVVKYRVPTREAGESGRWIGPVMDTQRALSLLRHRSKELGIDPRSVGVLGFSAGGATAAIAATRAGERLYPPIDSVDVAGCEASFAVLVYTGGLVDDAGTLRDFVRVTDKAPPTFLVHAADDRVTPIASTALFNALERQGVPAELHVFSRGGHGYGMRETDIPVTRWGTLLEAWLKDRGLLR